jgi:phosphate acetyltransferase
VAARSAELGVPLGGIEVRDPTADPRREEFAHAYLELRRHKGVTEAQARERASLPHYFAALMVQSGEADGFVSGLDSRTKPFIPAFEVIRLRDGFKRASSVFIMMVWPGRVLFYADCSVNIAPDPPTLAEIGRATAATARSFGLEPRVAFLSFSTRGSASHPDVERVRHAAALCHAAAPELRIDGELQFDAAFVPAVAMRKCPDSPLGGEANVFVFPGLDAGNRLASRDQAKPVVRRSASVCGARHRRRPSSAAVSASAASRMAAPMTWNQPV